MLPKFLAMRHESTSLTLDPLADRVSGTVQTSLSSTFGALAGRVSAARSAVYSEATSSHMALPGFESRAFRRYTNAPFPTLQSWIFCVYLYRHAKRLQPRAPAFLSALYWFSTFGLPSTFEPHAGTRGVAVVPGTIFHVYGGFDYIRAVPLFDNTNAQTAFLNSGTTRRSKSANVRKWWWLNA